MMVLGFEDLTAAVSAVPTILEFFPVALEMLDHTVISHTTERASPNEAGCLIFIEFAGNKKVEECFAGCRQALADKKCRVLEYVSDDQTIAKIWRARKGALNNIMKMTIGSRKPIGLIEATVVSPIFLADYTAYLLWIYNTNKLDYVMYGHVGDGNMHTRPLVNLDSEAETKLITRIAEDVFTKVISSGGTITGEPGDGLARVRYIEMMYGKVLAELFLKVKKMFDPNFLINPGKKVLV